jgi:hypothetical protein
VEGSDRGINEIASQYWSPGRGQENQNPPGTTYGVPAEFRTQYVSDTYEVSGVLVLCQPVQGLKLQLRRARICAVRYNSSRSASVGKDVRHLGPRSNSFSEMIGKRNVNI